MDSCRDISYFLISFLFVVLEVDEYSYTPAVILALEHKKFVRHAIQVAEPEVVGLRHLDIIVNKKYFRL